MKLHKRVLAYLGFLMMIWPLSSCQETTIQPLFNQDIVFELGKEGSGKDVAFGLVNADGSELEYWAFTQPVARTAKFPALSPDRTRLVYLMSFGMEGFSGDMMLVRGGKARDACSSSRIPTEAIDGTVRWTPDGQAWVASVSTRGIQLIDSRTCKAIQTLVPHPPDGSLRSPDLSVGNKVTYEMVVRKDCSGESKIFNCIHVMVKDLDTGTTLDLGKGMAPSWSPDGQWIALTRADGLYLVREDGTDERKLVEITDWWNRPRASLDPLRATWSPDGEWLVYHKFEQQSLFPGIFKLNVETGQEVRVVESPGVNPYWR